MGQGSSLIWDSWRTQVLESWARAPRDLMGDLCPGQHLSLGLNCFYLWRCKEFDLGYL